MNIFVFGFALSPPDDKLMYSVHMQMTLHVSHYMDIKRNSTQLTEANELNGNAKLLLEINSYTTRCWMRVDKIVY
jgi:hypothetical protein